MDKHDGNSLKMTEANKSHLEEENILQKRITTYVPQQPKTDTKLAQNAFFVANQPIQLLSQNKTAGIFPKFVLKKGCPPVTSSNVAKIASDGHQNNNQTFSIPQNNITLSPVKGGFKIPISPIKSPLKVSVIPPSSNVNSITTVDLNSVVCNSQSQHISNFQFQTVIPLQNRESKSSKNRAIKPQNISQGSGSRLSQDYYRLQNLHLIPSSSCQVSTTLSNPDNSCKTEKGQQEKPLNTTAVEHQKFNLISNMQTVRSSAPPLKTQRLIMPAKTVPQNQTVVSDISPGSYIQPGNVGYAMVPAKYVEQLKQQLNNQMHLNTNAATKGSIESSKPVQVVAKVPTPAKVHKPCNCTKSMCLKLYCECFANGHFCEGCNCVNCHNNMEHESDRSYAIKICLDRNPSAFRPKIGRGCNTSRTHQKGCNCKRSGCLKNYCECYEARISCTSKCKCIGCKNVEDSAKQIEQHSLMNLADAAAVRSQQQATAQSKINSRLEDIRTTHPNVQIHSSVRKENQTSTFFTKEIIEATCTCMLAQAEEAEKTNRSMQVAEMMVLEEFGRCLMQIIQAAGKAKTVPP